MQRLGSQVTMVVRGGTLMSKDDPEAGKIAEEVFQEEGLQVHFKANLLRVEPAGAELKCTIESGGKEQEMTFDKILVAAGRIPNTDGLGLEAAGVEFDRRGVKVNHLHQTTNKRIYAAGDICSPMQFTHAAFAQAEFATLNALMPYPYRLNARDRVMSWVTYTDPEVAHAGISWPDLQKMDVDVYELPMKDNDRSQTESEHRGFCRIYCKKGKDKILAGTIVCENAGEMIAELSLAITRGLKLRHIQETIHAYPTRVEVIRNVATEWKFTTLTPSVKSMVGMWLKLSRKLG